jgi:hypothetical protein
VCECLGAWACTCVRACSLAYPARNLYAPYCDVICGLSGSTTFFDIISETHYFRKKSTEHKLCFDFLYSLRLENFLFCEEISKVLS